MFRNLRFYRLDGNWPDNEKSLSKKLEAAAFSKCGPLTDRSSGWERIDADHDDALARRVNGADLLRLRSQSRVLPAAVIKEELDLRIESFKQRMQEPPGARQKRRMKAEIRDEFLPKAMLKSDRIWGYVDLQQHILGIDTALESVAERFLRRLRVALGEIDIRPLQFGRPVDELLTRIFSGEAPGPFALGRECRMQDTADAKSMVRWVDFDLQDQAVRRHMDSSLRLTHLGVVYDEVMHFLLDQNGVVSKLRFTGVDNDESENGDALAKLDTEFVLASGLLRRFLESMSKSLGGFT